MRARLDELGVPGVRCSTFHSAALGQLRFFAAEPPQRILASKALPLRHIGNTLRRPYRFRPAADLATEIEWAKNRRIPPDDYLALARRPRAADPVRPHAARLPRVRAAQGRPGLGRLRGSARADDPALRRGRGRARAGARPLPRLHGRRVPGRQPPPADAPRPLARRPGRAVRGRRRLPVDLRVHRGEPRAPALDAEALSRTRRSFASRRTTARPRRCSSSRTGSSRSSAAPRRFCARPGLRGRCPSRARSRSRSSRRRSSSNASASFTPAARRTRRWRSSSGRTRAQPTTRRR